MPEWTIGAVLDAIADVVPDRLMTACGERRSTFAQTAVRTNQIASFCGTTGLVCIVRGRSLTGGNAAKIGLR